MENEVLYQAIIPLAPITKKNHQQIMYNRKTGRRWVAQSKDYIKYARESKEYLKSPCCIDTPVNIQMLFYMPTQRRVDLSNLQSACLDILVDAKVILDDNCKIVVSHDGSKVFYDKENPRTEIIITQYKKI